ncbi:MAG: hypothetical protein Q4D89_14380 [Arachnia propionica]|uniref:hypothetical protein n=1 Tax=Arachnia propionica TaxID=1750 RepID=UPI0026FD3D63|nr:hypothetical protein [Arachnia propionica]
MSDQPQSEDGLVMPSAFPVQSSTINVDNVNTAASDLRSMGKDVDTHMDNIVTHWNGLPAVYVSPESAQVYTMMDSAATSSESLKNTLDKAADAIETYATELKPIKTTLETLEKDAAAFREEALAGYDGKPWKEDKGAIKRNTELLRRYANVYESLTTASSNCANSINGLYTQSTPEQVVPVSADAVMAHPEMLPWGSPVKKDRTCTEEAVDTASYLSFPGNPVGGIADALVLSGFGSQTAGDAWRSYGTGLWNFFYNNWDASASLLGFGSVPLGQAWWGFGNVVVSTMFSGVVPQVILRNSGNDETAAWAQERLDVTNTAVASFVGYDYMAAKNGGDGWHLHKEDPIAAKTEAQLNIATLLIPSPSGAAAGGTRAAVAGGSRAAVIASRAGRAAMLAADFMVPGGGWAVKGVTTVTGMGINGVRTGLKGVTAHFGKPLPTPAGAAAAAAPHTPVSGSLGLDDAPTPPAKGGGGSGGTAPDLGDLPGAADATPSKPPTKPDNVLPDEVMDTNLPPRDPGGSGSGAPQGPSNPAPDPVDVSSSTPPNSGVGNSSRMPDLETRIGNAAPEKVPAMAGAPAAEAAAQATRATDPAVVNVAGEGQPKVGGAAESIGTKDAGAGASPEITGPKAPEPVRTTAPEPSAPQMPEPVGANAPEPVGTRTPETTAPQMPEPVGENAPKTVGSRSGAGTTTPSDTSRPWLPDMEPDHRHDIDGRGGIDTWDPEPPVGELRKAPDAGDPVTPDIGDGHLPDVEAKATDGPAAETGSQTTRPVPEGDRDWRLGEDGYYHEAADPDWENTFRDRAGNLQYKTGGFAPDPNPAEPADLVKAEHTRVANPEGLDDVLNRPDGDGGTYQKDLDKRNALQEKHGDDLAKVDQAADDLGITPTDKKDIKENGLEPTIQKLESERKITPSQGKEFKEAFVAEKQSLGDLRKASEKLGERAGEAVIEARQETSLFKGDSQPGAHRLDDVGVDLDTQTINIYEDKWDNSRLGSSKVDGVPHQQGTSGYLDKLMREDPRFAQALSDLIENSGAKGQALKEAIENGTVEINYYVVRARPDGTVDIYKFILDDDPELPELPPPSDKE